jgi:hypothetical protein
MIFGVKAFVSSFGLMRISFGREGFVLMAKRIKVGNIKYICIRLSLPKTYVFYNSSLDMEKN